MRATPPPQTRKAASSASSGTEQTDSTSQIEKGEKEDFEQCQVLTCFKFIDLHFRITRRTLCIQ